MFHRSINFKHRQSDNQVYIKRLNFSALVFIIICKKLQEIINISQQSDLKLFMCIDVSYRTALMVKLYNNCKNLHG